MADVGTVGAELALGGGGPGTPPGLWYNPGAAGPNEWLPPGGCRLPPPLDDVVDDGG